MSGLNSNLFVAAVCDRRTGGHRAPLQYFVCLLSSVLCLLPAGCGRREAAPANQTLRIAQRNEPATLDPQLATLPDEFFIIRALSEGLVTPSPVGGTVIPAIASHWEATDNWTTWTFHLGGNATWTNGDTVTAQDFVHMIRRALTPATAAPRASLFFPLRNAAAFLRGTITDFTQVGVAAPDERTLVITLGHSMPGFSDLVASGPWIPVHPATVEKFGVDWTRPEHFVGNGPFTLKEWLPNQRIVVRKNPRFRASHLIELAAIQFLAFDSGDTEERAFRAGQVDITMAVPSSKLDTYRNAEPSLLHTVPLHETRYLALNTTKAPLNDLRVRRALSLALEREVLVSKVLKSGQRPALSFVPPGLGRFQPAGALGENLDEARRLLAAAGFPDGRGFPKLELSTWSVSTPQLEAIQQMWRDRLGIEVAIVQREARTHLAALAAGDFDIGFATAIPDYNSATDLLDHFTSGHPGNYPHWDNAAFDRLVAGDRLPEAEKLLLDEMPVIPLYFNAKNFLLRPAVHGWQEDALWTRYYQNVSLHEKRHSEP
jgi:oligopeptide transport system substrate-binding protein